MQNDSEACACGVDDDQDPVSVSQYLLCNWNSSNTIPSFDIKTIITGYQN